jgi:methylenetetrahydrofolate dehydrogenase (NADP+)/methenyltetrahydrofolate cyclohydrolase
MLLAELEALNSDPAVSGILLQTPFPAGVDAGRLWAGLDPRKDAEGISPASLGRALKGEEAQAPCTARAAFALVKASGIDPKGVEAVVVGRSAIVGKPAALLLVDAGATVTLCRSTTRDLASHTRRADVLVVAVGKPGFITGDMIKPGAVVVDVGIHAGGGRLVGDVDFPSVSPVAGWLTPVPGGLGPVTVAMLLERCVAAALARR